MRRNTGYIKKRNERISNDLFSQDFARSKTLNAVTIALGQLGCDADFLRRFRDEFREVEADIHGMLEKDFKEGLQDDRKNVLAQKLKFANTMNMTDKLIKQYIYPEDFYEFKYRWHLEIPPKEKK